MEHVIVILNKLNFSIKQLIERPVQKPTAGPRQQCCKMTHLRTWYFFSVFI